MDKKNLDILTNIIGGVETGGQTYGKRNYASYVAPGKNTANEKTCTLGWAGNYGERAKRLCKMILEQNPAAFRKVDTAGIEKKLSVNWETTKWHPTAKEKAALIAIITTPTGKECQDALFQELMQAYLKEAEAYGVTDVPSQMMWCEIQHLGGIKPVQRIFKRAEKPYTPDIIYASLLLDQKDISNNNQVPDVGSLNTAGMHKNWKKVTDVVIKNGIIQNPEVLKVGDALMFKGSDSSRPLGIGHTEMVYEINGKTAASATPAATSSKKDIVKAGQMHANNFTGAGLVVDGVRGTLTKKAGIMAVQTALNLDFKAGLKVDGEWGPKSDAALKKRSVRLGSTRYLVTAVEILLMLKGYNPNGVECPGQFGSGCAAATGNYQTDHSLKADKIAGYDTIKSLIA